MQSIIMSMTNYFLSPSCPKHVSHEQKNLSGSTQQILLMNDQEDNQRQNQVVGVLGCPLDIQVNLDIQDQLVKNKRKRKDTAMEDCQ